MRKLILHIHLFKNSGSSIDRLLSESFGARWANIDGPFPWSRISNDELVAFADKNAGLVAISSHQVRPPLPERADWRLFPIVFLRHPIDRVASAYLFEKQNGPLAPDAGLSDYVIWQIERKTSTAVRNFHVAALSGAASDPGSPRGIDPDVEHLEKAKKFLGTLNTFGIVEQFDRSVLRFQASLQPHFPGLNLRPVHENKSSNRPAAIDDRLFEVRQNLGEDLWGKLLTANALDLELYDFAIKLFEKGDVTNSKRKGTFGLMFQSKLKVKIASLEEERKELRRENKRLEKKLNAKKETAFAPPGHFYSPVPGPEDIEGALAGIANPAPLEGVDFDDAGQLELLKRLAVHVKDLPFPVERDEQFRYGYSNPAFSYGDAVPLFCMMREIQPRRVIEVGCGYSSCLMLDTNERFFDNKINLTFIEPYPKTLRSLIRPGDEGRFKLVEKKLQDADLNLFRALEKGDFLFIDSSHVVKTGSDVRHLFSRILPILNKGVIIHIHDMFDQFEYPEHWLREGRAWNEDYMMHAFLQFNSAFRIKLFTAYMRRKYPEWFRENMEPCTRRPSGNLWLGRVA